MNTVTIIIRKLRRFKGFTQMDLADRLHLSLKAYQKIERGITRLDIERLESIAGILEVSVADLINAKNKTKGYPEELKAGTPYDDTGLNKEFVQWGKRLLQIIIEAKGQEVAYLNEASL